MSAPINDGGSAFPVLENNGDRQLVLTSAGMSLRDYFAAKAMQSLVLRLSGGPGIGNDHDGLLTNLAGEAYAMADAMLKARAA